jgi:uncharacterized membrane protein YccC
MNEDDYRINSKTLRILGIILGLLLAGAGGLSLCFGMPKVGLLWLLWGIFFLWVAFRKSNRDK